MNLKADDGTSNRALYAIVGLLLAVLLVVAGCTIAAKQRHVAGGNAIADKPLPLRYGLTFPAGGIEENQWREFDSDRLGLLPLIRWRIGQHQRGSFVYGLCTDIARAFPNLDPRIRRPRLRCLGYQGGDVVAQRDRVLAFTA